MLPKNLLLKALTFLLLLLLGSHSQATSPSSIGDLGVGAEIGGESSVSLQRAYSDLSSYNIGLGTYDKTVNLYADHLWYLTRDTLLHPFVGAGLGAAFDDSNDPLVEDVRGLIRLPIGVSYYTREVPLNLFAQLVPSFDTEKDSEVFGQVGLKYFFR